MNTTKSLLIQRNRLCAVLYSYLLENYRSDFETKQLQISFQQKISTIDFTNHIVSLVTGEKLPYDLLIGCDGVNSIVRKSLESHLQQLSKVSESPSSFQSEEYLLPWQFKVMSQPIPVQLEADAIHAFPDMSRFFSAASRTNQASSSSSFSLFCIPTVQQDLATVINWNRDAPPAFLTLSNFTDKEISSKLQREINEIFASQYPSFGSVSETAIKQLVSQSPSNIRKVRCNRYHDLAGKVCLIGDAAHATDATWGQGLSATFLDIEALDHCLTITRDQIELAFPLYSERQVKEGLALWQLIALPPRGLPGLFFSVYQFLLGIMRRVPVVGQLVPIPIQYEISKTLRPYSEIVKKNQFWTDLATSGQAAMEYTPSSSESIRSIERE